MRNSSGKIMICSSAFSFLRIFLQPDKNNWIRWWWCCRFFPLWYVFRAAQRLCRPHDPTLPQPNANFFIKKKICLPFSCFCIFFTVYFCIFYVFFLNSLYISCQFESCASPSDNNLISLSYWMPALSVNLFWLFVIRDCCQHLCFPK